MIKSALISLLYLTKQSLSAGGTTWDYHHMSAWSTSYSMCNNEDQSPIDIISSEAIYDDEICNAFFDWDIEYDITDFKVTNNGHAIVLQAVQESTIDPDGDLSETLSVGDKTYETLGLSENTIAKFPNYFKPETSPHEEFCLHSLHFHWGQTDTTGSEHFIDGFQYPLEIHFVHYSCEHASLGTTLEQFNSERNVEEFIAAERDVHQLGVVGIFFDIIEPDSETGEEYINPAFDVLLNDNVIDAVKLPKHKDTIINGFNLNDLIPDSIEIDGYYAYQGSLTTPPCTDIVRWHVMQARGAIGSGQMEQFRKLKQNVSGDIEQIAPNYREIQENINVVYGCMNKPIFEEANESLIRGIVWIVAIISAITPIVMGVICCKKAKEEMAHGDGHHAGHGHDNKHKNKSNKDGHGHGHTTGGH